MCVAAVASVAMCVANNVCLLRTLPVPVLCVAVCVAV